MFKVVFWASSWSCTVVDVSVAFAGALQLLLLLLSLSAVRCPLSLSCCCCWCSLLLGGYGTGKAPFLFEVRHKSLRVWGVQAFRPCSCGISTSGAFMAKKRASTLPSLLHQAACHRRNACSREDDRLLRGHRVPPMELICKPQQSWMQ